MCHWAPLCGRPRPSALQTSAFFFAKQKRRRRSSPDPPPSFLLCKKSGASASAKRCGAAPDPLRRGYAHFFAWICFRLGFASAVQKEPIFFASSGAKKKRSSKPGPSPSAPPKAEKAWAEAKPRPSAFGGAEAKKSGAKGAKVQKVQRNKDKQSYVQKKNHPGTKLMFPARLPTSLSTSSEFHSQVRDGLAWFH